VTIADVLEGRARWYVLCADARNVGLGCCRERSVVVTDPVWPNAPEGIYGPDIEPWDLLRVVASRWHICARRAVVQLGCMSDPRILSGIPKELPFVRACWLRYTIPSYHGTVLNSGDLAYVFGSREGPQGRTVLPGEVTSLDSDGAAEADRRRGNLDEYQHPSPRRLSFVLWLVEMLTRTDDCIIDPFCGSGTTGVAAVRLGRRFIGIEKDPKYAQLARDRIAAEEQGSTLQAKRAGQEPLFR
jgi:hypothetical protein